MGKEKTIRNSTVDFLIFTKQSSEEGISVRVEDETIWLTQQSIATLFDKGRTTITEHIKEIYLSGELDFQSTCRKFRQVGSTGQEYWPQFYNLDMIAILNTSGNVTHEMAKQFAESEFEKYRLIQDALYTSDFDLFAQAIEE